jgi:hypothetical protein
LAVLLAIVRCLDCGKPRAKTPPDYATTPRRPVGYPQSGVICGSKDCRKPALVWLKLDEDKLYQSGEHVFSFPTLAAKVAVE